MLGKLFGNKEKTHGLKIDGVDKTISISSKETLLQAALKDGVKFPHSCRVGGCAMCKCRLVSGKVKELTEKSYILSAEELQTGYILACQSLPRSDVQVEVDFSRADIPEHDLVTTTAEIIAQNPLTHDISEIVIATDKDIEFTAGQFAEITVPGQIADARSYSFGSAPGRYKNEVHFFVRAVPGGEMSNWVLGNQAVGSKVELQGPFGDFYLRSSDKPMLCVAGGSGLAPVLAVLEDAANREVNRSVTFLFGARTEQDLYCLDQIEAIKARWKGEFNFVAVLSDEPKDSAWEGARGFVTAHFETHCDADAQLYMCGPPPMIDAAIAEAHKNGVDDKNIFFDKFLDKSDLQKPKQVESAQIA
ncbi:MAG: oxidoreductase [Moraxellaceae bacterium]|nr:MAG: oxidoreductase [Moraxellaceae bacterium]